MKQANCEDVLMAAMALADGEKESGLARAEIDAHLAGCENCRFEMEQAAGTIRLLEARARRTHEADLWPEIEKRISKNAKSPAPVLWLLGALLIAYKLLEMLPGEAPGHAFRIVPVVIVAAVFILLRENPFKIKTELIPER